MILVVAFSCQGHWVGIEARQVAGMGSLAQWPQPGWKRADLRFLFPEAPLNDSSDGFGLALRVHAGTVLVLERKAELVELESSQVWSLPAVLEQARRHPCIKALAWYEGRPMLVLEPDLLPF